MKSLKMTFLYQMKPSSHRSISEQRSYQMQELDNFSSEFRSDAGMGSRTSNLRG